MDNNSSAGVDTRAFPSAAACEPFSSRVPPCQEDCRLPYGHADLVGVLAVGVEVAVAVAHLLLAGRQRGVAPLAQVGLQAAAGAGTAGCGAERWWRVNVAVLAQSGEK